MRGTHAVWSPDGSKLAVVRRGLNGSADIHVLDVADGRTYSLVADPANDWGPAWSPDGSKIAFTRGEQVFIVNADGSDERPFAGGQGPAWAPDGSRLAVSVLTGPFVQIGPNSYLMGPKLFVVGRDGTATQLVTNDTAVVFTKAWAPDGARIAFCMARVTAYPTLPADIYLINPDGGDLVNLTNSSADEWGPAWSPDASKIAFAIGYQIYVMNADGSDAVNISRNAYVDWYPSWRRPR
jgi:TolB protein